VDFARRNLSDAALLQILFLAVVGNFTVDQDVASSQALGQKCTLVVDPGSGRLVLRDNSVNQSIVLEVLLIISIVCLLKAWEDNNSGGIINKTTRGLKKT
jgi:hypothetical protein